MKRKQFLVNGLKAIGAISIIPLSGSCTRSSLSGDDDIEPGDCAVSPPETPGPFPTKNPSSLVTSDIRSDRTGVPLVINLTINNRNQNCTALEGAIVDIWHCDKDGNYSEYGNTGIQSANYTSVHFLRGRQVTDKSGLVSFTSIYPGWYPGRAPHIHVHIYDQGGRSLLVTQIAFPADINDTVYTTATTYYTNGTQDTSNERDNIFSDSLALQLATVTGDINDGYSLSHLITVEASS